MGEGGTIVFETSRLVVRLATEADVEVLYALWTNPEVMTPVGFPFGLRITRSEIRARIQGQDDSAFDQLLIITHKTTGQALGECLMQCPDQDGVARTDLKLLPEFRGKRYGVEIKTGLLSHLFTHTDCVAVDASPNVDNAASIHMQEAVGGKRIGEAVYEFPEAMRAYTKPVHHYIYRVEKSTWTD